jgi:hypothetical protein
MLQPETAPHKKSSRTSEQQRAVFIVQAKLMARQTALAEMDWVEKYSAVFRDLFTNDDDFAELVKVDADDKALADIQSILDKRIEQ